MHKQRLPVFQPNSLTGMILYTDKIKDAIDLQSTKARFWIEPLHSYRYAQTVEILVVKLVTMAMPLADTCLP